MAAKVKSKGEYASAKGKGGGGKCETCRIEGCDCPAVLLPASGYICTSCDHHISYHWPEGACVLCGMTPAASRWDGMRCCSPACGAWLGDEAAKNCIDTR